MLSAHAAEALRKDGLGEHLQSCVPRCCMRPPGMAGAVLFWCLSPSSFNYISSFNIDILCHAVPRCAPLHILQRKLKALIGNYTFLEAYERTGRILNVSVCPADTNEPARLLNYLTAPQVKIPASRGRAVRLLACVSFGGGGRRAVLV